jgi:hypothetical protein
MTDLHVVRLPDGHPESPGRCEVDVAGGPSFQQGDRHITGPFDNFEDANRAALVLEAAERRDGDCSLLPPCEGEWVYLLVRDASLGAYMPPTLAEWDAGEARFVEVWLEDVDGQPPNLEVWPQADVIAWIPAVVTPAEAADRLLILAHRAEVEGA